MKLRHWITAIVLLLLMGAAIGGLLWTRDLPQESEETTATPTKKTLGKKAAAAQHPLVDQRPLQTAQRMAALAATPEEQSLAHEAEKTGDHEVDLAFFDAIRSAQQNPPPLSADAKEISARKTKAQQAVKDDQDNVAQLTRKLAAAPETQKDNLQDQLDVAKAQMDLDQDELDDATEDLDQAGGDPQSKIKRLQAEHEAGEHNGTATVGSAVNPHEQDYQTHTLFKVFRAWQAFREKKVLLEQAREETAEKQKYLEQKHAQLEAQVEKDKESRDAAKQQAKGFSKGSVAANRDDSKAAAKAALDSLKQYTIDQKNLAIVSNAKLILRVHENQPVLRSDLLPEREQRQRLCRTELPLLRRHPAFGDDLLGRDGAIMRRLLRELATTGEVKGDTTTLEDFSVIAKLREGEE